MTQLMINGDLPHQTIEQLRRFARLMDSNDSEQRLWSSLSQLDRDFVGNKIKIRYGNGRVAAIWQLARNTSAERAIVDAAYELGFMDAGMHRQLLTEVWEQAYGQDQTIDVHVSWLRRKLGESASEPRYIHTVRGVGVRLAAPE